MAIVGVAQWVGGIATVVKSGGEINFSTIGFLMMDLFAIYGLSQYVLYKPIPHVWLRISYLVIACMLTVRFIFAAYFAWAYFSWIYLEHWTWTREQLSVFIGLLGIVLGMFVVYALVRYSTMTQPTHSSTAPPKP